MKKIKTILMLALALFIVCAANVYPDTAEAASQYYAIVDVTNQYVTVYRTSDMEIVRQMICSTGKPTTPSPIGTFYMPTRRRSDERQKWYTFSDCYGQYASRINGPYLFHSYLFSAKRDSAVISSSVYALGTAASHGCIRLRIYDAKWIAENLFSGTKVKIYKSGVRNDSIRALLLKGSYSIDSGKTYNEWASIGEDGELGRGSVGAKVLTLQRRLVGMGYAVMTADGEYGQKTVDAVYSLQKAVGLTQTGVVDDDTWDALFSDDLPAGNEKSTLYEGANGALVEDMQKTLSTLKFYEGDISGEFDKETVAAVNMYKKTHGMSENGKLSYSNRKAAEDEAKALLERFDGRDYDMVLVDYDVLMAKVKGKDKIYMREEANAKSKKLLTLSKGSEMTVLENGIKWTKVQKSGKTGYAQTKYLKQFTVINTFVAYKEMGEPDPTPIPTPPPAVTPEPSLDPTTEPTLEPIASPTIEPSAAPTTDPSEDPTTEPTNTITPVPTFEPDTDE